MNEKSSHLFEWFRDYLMVYLVHGLPVERKPKYKLAQRYVGHDGGGHRTFVNQWIHIWYREQIMFKIH